MSDRLFSIRPCKGITVSMFATGRDYRGATTVEVVVRENGRTVFGPGVDGMRLTGALSPLDSDDGADARRYALTFAAMRPGDTDAEFFAGYSQAQLDWADANGEQLWMIALDRYGEV